MIDGYCFVLCYSSAIRQLYRFAFSLDWKFLVPDANAAHVTTNSPNPSPRFSSLKFQAKRRRKKNALHLGHVVVGDDM